MGRGKYFNHSLKILELLYEGKHTLDFTIQKRNSSLSDLLGILKSSLFDVLKQLKEKEYVKISTKQYNFTTGLVVYFLMKLHLHQKEYDFTLIIDKFYLNDSNSDLLILNIYAQVNLKLEYSIMYTFIQYFFYKFPNHVLGYDVK